MTHEDIEEIDQLRWKKKQLLTPLKILVNVKPQKLHKMEKKKKIEQKKKKKLEKKDQNGKKIIKMCRKKLRSQNEIYSV